MRDYEEPVKSLRENAEWADGNIWEVPIMLPDNLRQAADAIEELQKRVELEYQSGFADGQRAANRKKNKWINVKERLPEENGRYLVVLKRCGFVNDIKLNDEEIKILRYHNGWRLPYHIPEWINETLKQEVTHWMPLPEPPKVKK